MGLALASGSVAEARAAIARVDAAVFNPFHLVIADRYAAFLWRYDGERAAIDELGPGLHVITERSPQGLDRRGELVRNRWPLDFSVARLHELLSVHSDEPGAGTCLHLGEEYGTRSTAIVRMAEALPGMRYRAGPSGA